MKFPKIYHLPWSEGITRDDKILDYPRLEKLLKKHLIVTEKMDGENISLYNDKIHARSEDSKFHPSRSFIINLHSQIKHEIPKDLQIVGEYLYAIHSIEYDHLTSKSLFQVFCIFNLKENIVLSWNDTLSIIHKLKLSHVPIANDFKSGIKEGWTIKHGFSRYGQKREGFVVRNINEFAIEDWNENIAKWVRKDHVQTNEHWSRKWKPYNYKDKLPYTIKSLIVK